MAYVDNYGRIIQNEELYHHGILGMKWGVRHDHYPLDASEHTAAEKKAGYKKSIDGGSQGTKQKKGTAKKVAKVALGMGVAAVAAYAVTHPEQARAVINAGKRASESVFGKLKNRRVSDTTYEPKMSREEGKEYVDNFLKMLKEQRAPLDEDMAKQKALLEQYRSGKIVPIKRAEVSTAPIQRTEVPRAAVKKTPIQRTEVPRAVIQRTPAQRTNVERTKARLQSNELPAGWSEQFKNWLKRNPNVWDLSEMEQWQRYDWR